MRGNRQLIDSVRPYDLSQEEQALYNYRDSLRASRASVDTLTTDTLIQQPKPRKHNYLRDIAWEKLGESLIRSLKASNEDGYVRLSPIINPQYFSYSERKGFSYRFKLGARYNLSDNVSLGMNTRFGYNFKQRKFYFNLPLRLDYSYRQRDAYAEVAWGSGTSMVSWTCWPQKKNC